MTGPELRSTLRGHAGRVWCAAFSPDGRTLATAGADATVKLWDTTREPAFEPFAAEARAHRVALSPRADTSVVLGQDRHLSVWSHDSVQLVRKSVNEQDYAPHPLLAVSPAGVTIVLSNRREKYGPDRLELWDRGHRLRAAFDVGDLIVCAALSADGSLLACGRHDYKIEVWDLAGSREPRTLDGHGGSIKALVFSPDGRILAAASQDTTIGLWDPASGKKRLDLRGHRSGVASVAFAADGRTLATGGQDRTVRLWDAGTGRELATLLGHQGVVNGVAFSPDGNTLASGGDDRTVRLWHVATGQELFVLPAHTGPITGLAFVADGRSLVSAAVGSDQASEFFLWPPRAETPLTPSP